MSTGFIPQLSTSLQQQLNSLENTQTSYVATYVGAAASSAYSAAVLEAQPYISEQSNLQSQVSALQSLSTALTTLQTNIQTLASQSSWISSSATSSNTNALTVTANEGAPQTTVQFNVTAVAAGQQSLLNLTASSSTAASSLTAGNLQIDGASGSQTIQVTAGETLQNLTTAINAVTQQTGVQAGVQYNGSTYQILLSATGTGTTNGVFSIGSGTTATNGSATIAVQSTIQSATDASLVLGSGGSAQTITSQTNTFTDAVPGTTITAVATGSGTITISPSAQTPENAMTSFFSAYNAVANLVYGTGSAANTQVGQSIAQQLSIAVGALFSNGSNPYQSMAQLGVLTTPGSYSISNGTFTASSGPTIGFETSTSIPNYTPPAGVSVPNGEDTFSNAVINDASDVQQLLGVTSNGEDLPSNSVLGELNQQVTQWLNDLNGTDANGVQIQGEIGRIQNQLGSEPNPSGGTIQYQLDQLQSQYQNQVQALVTQWQAAQTAIAEAQSQMSQLQAVVQMSQSSLFQTTSLLG